MLWPFAGAKQRIRSRDDFAPPKCARRAGDSNTGQVISGAPSTSNIGEGVTRGRCARCQWCKGEMEIPLKVRPVAQLRDYLAEERTFLAWIRTAVALMGFGFVVARFGIFGD